LGGGTKIEETPNRQQKLGNLTAIWRKRKKADLLAPLP